MTRAQATRWVNALRSGKNLSEKDSLQVACEIISLDPDYDLESDEATDVIQLVYIEGALDE